MLFIRVISFLFFMIYFMSCASKENVEIPLVIKESVNEFKIDNNKIFINRVADIIQYDDKLIIVDKNELNLFIVDSNFNLKKHFSFQDNEYLFKGRIFSATRKEDKLYFIDNTYLIKELDLDTYTFKTINYNNMNVKGNSYIRNIIFTNDTTFIASTSHISKAYENLIVGRKFTSNGRLLQTFEVGLDKLNYNDFILKDFFTERCYVNIIDGFPIFSFKTSKMCVKFDLNGNFIESFKLAVNDKTYLEPHRDEIGNYISNVCGHKLEVNKNKIYHIVTKAPEIGALIIEYDSKFNILNKYSVSDNIIGYKYGLRKIGNNFYYFHNESSSVYLAKVDN